MKAIAQKFFPALTFLFLMFGFVVSIHAADGDLDTGFDTDGKVVIDFDGVSDPSIPDNDFGIDVAIQADGKTILVGEARIGQTDTAFSITRLNADGSLDTTFGTNGKVINNLNIGGTDAAAAVAIQADGKIIVAGNSMGRTVRTVLRYNADGTLDTTFGTNGVYSTPIGTTNLDAADIAVQPDGKIIVSGSVNHNGAIAFGVLRLNSNGTLDDTFGTAGKAATTFVANDRAYAVALQADGKIIVGGQANFNTMAIARYNADGTLDTSFDTDGKATISHTGATSAVYGLTVQPDGKIIIAGYKRGLHSDAALVRLNANGSLDTTFDGDGIATYDAGQNLDELLYDVSVINGKIVGTGFRTSSTGVPITDFMLLRFNDNGGLDTGFGTNGVIYTTFNGSSADLSLNSAFKNGKLTLVGYTNSPAPAGQDFAAARYNFAATPRDALVDFNGDGKTDWAVARRNGPISPWTWFIRHNGEENLISVQWGQSPTDLFQPVDYDGDGKDDIAVWRDNGYFYILNSSDNSFRAVFVGGVRNDRAVAADYDGDGKDDPAVFISPQVAQGAGQSNWCYVGSLNNPNQTVTCVQWGMRYGTQQDQVDDPYPGDFDGDGKADFRVQRRSDITLPTSNQPAIFWTRTATGNVSYDYFGISSDRIVPGDYDGDGKTDIAVTRGFNIGTNPPTPIQWFIRYSSGQPDDYINFGQGINFNFAQGDYDGDGKDDIALYVNVSGQMHFAYRPSSNTSEGMRTYQFGLAPTGPGTGDLPVAGYNNR